MDNNKKKTQQLGMPIGTASAILRKNIMFALIRQLDLDICFQCGERIEGADELSIEHKVPYLDSKNPKELFFSLDNIAFSHLTCNIGARRHKAPQHGRRNMYSKYGCRCKECRAAEAEYAKSQRSKSNMPS